MRHKHRTTAALLVAMSALALMGARCSSEQAARTPATPRQAKGQTPALASESSSATSPQAPFTLELPDEFERIDPALVNADAMLVARTRDEQVMIMVIASPIPALAGVTPPDTRELRQQAIQLMRHNLSKVELIERGERQIGSQPALTARLIAEVGGQPHLYELAYMQHQSWRYQLIAFSHSASHELLKQRVDQIVGAWRFKSS